MNPKFFSEKTILADVLKYPGAEKILAKHKIFCSGCPFFALEAKNLKIGEVCRAYGLNAKNLLKELNEKIWKKKKPKKSLKK